MSVSPRRLVSVLLASALASLAGPRLAWSHAQLVRSDPADQARLKEAPAHVDLWFDERLDEGFHSVRVIAIRGQAKQASAQLVKGPPRVDYADPSHLVTDLAPLPPGHYAVEWRVLSRDGHTAAGRLSFEIQATP